MTSHTHTSLEALSSPELETLLQQNFAAETDDPDLVLAIMDVLARRDPQAIEIDDAWEIFRARCLPPQSAAPADPPRPPPTDLASPPSRRRLIRRGLLAAAAVLCLMALPVCANGPLQDLIHWNDESFQLTPKDSSEPRLSIPYQDVQEVVAAQTDLPVLPTWYPEGTEVGQLEVTELSDRCFIDVMFYFNESVFTFSLTIYDSIPENPSALYEKNPGIPEDYYVNGIHHYFYTNMEHVGVAWWNKNAECSFLGDISQETLKQMVDSIYA